MKEYKPDTTEHKTCIKQFSLVTENLCRCCLMRLHVQSTVGDSANSIPLYQHQNHYSIPWLAVFNCWEHTDSNLEEILPCLFVNGRIWESTILNTTNWTNLSHRPQRPLFVTQVCTVILPLSMPCAFQGTNLRYIHFKNTMYLLQAPRFPNLIHWNFRLWGVWWLQFERKWRCGTLQDQAVQNMIQHHRSLFAGTRPWD